jgi:hypothetical protein
MARLPNGAKFSTMLDEFLRDSLNYLFTRKLINVLTL